VSRRGVDVALDVPQIPGLFRWLVVVRDGECQRAAVSTELALCPIYWIMRGCPGAARPRWVLARAPRGSRNRGPRALQPLHTPPPTGLGGALAQQKVTPSSGCYKINPRCRCCCCRWHCCRCVLRCAAGYAKDCCTSYSRALCFAPLRDALRGAMRRSPHPPSCPYSASGWSIGGCAST
jgi:hypothetical protein